MANISKINGLTPVMYKNGQPYTGIVRRYYKDATAGILARGDAVIRVTSSSDPEGGPEVVKATVGAAMTGSIVGIQPHPDRPGRHGYLAAADVGYVFVADDPNLLFEVEEGGSGTALAVTDIGLHIDAITNANANTTRERSVLALDNGAKAADNTFILVALSPKPDNEVGAAAKWLVAINLHTEVNASATNITQI